MELSESNTCARLQPRARMSDAQARLRQGAERGARVGGPPSATSRARHHTARSQTWPVTWHRPALEAAEQQALGGDSARLATSCHHRATLWQDMQVPAGREAAHLSVLGMQSMPAMRARAPRSVPGAPAAARPCCAASAMPGCRQAGGQAGRGAGGPPGLCAPTTVSLRAWSRVSSSWLRAG